MSQLCKAIGWFPPLAPLIVSPRIMNAGLQGVDVRIISSVKISFCLRDAWTLNKPDSKVVQCIFGVVSPIEDFSVCFVPWTLIKRACCASALWKAWLYCGKFVGSDEEGPPWEAESFLGFSYGMTIPELFLLAMKRKIKGTSHFLK